MTRTSTLRMSRVGGAAVLAASFLFSEPAAADITLVEKDGWTVFLNGRLQAFLNYNRGNGHPTQVQDANGELVTTQGGGVERGQGIPEFPDVTALNDPGRVEEMRVRSGFTGNVLGFGIKKQITKDTDILGYTAVTTYIESTERRKYTEIRPDWRQGFLKITGPWGAFTAGRDLTLFSRGATEITFLYGFKYGLGWPGSVTYNGPTAGHVGFGVLANGFGAGMSYTTPSLGGAQLQIGLFDANNLPGTVWEKNKWPRAEGELWYEMKLDGLGMFKLFANGAYQKNYQREVNKQGDIYGVGYGGRVEVGPVHLGLAGHYGVGVGLDFALQPSQAIFHEGHEDHNFRTFDGYYAQLMVSALPTLDVMAGAGITRVKLLTEDTQDWRDTDMNPATPSANDDGNAAIPDSVGTVPVKQQLGFSGGVAYHFTDYIHLQVEYFRAMYEWYRPSPSLPGVEGPKQAFHVVNAGVTYDF